MNIDNFEKIKDKVYQNFPMVNGLFSKMNYTFWDFNNSDLDVMLISHCGFKKISPIVKIANEINPTDPMQYLADMILNTYKRRWDRLQELTEIEYDPIRNYSDILEKEITEDSSGNDLSKTDNERNSKQNQNTIKEDTSDGTKLLSNSGQDANKLERNLKNKLSGTDTSQLTRNLQDELPSKIQNDVYGFNSTSPVGNDVSTKTSTEKHTGNSTESTNYGKTQDETGNQTNTITYGKVETETNVLKDGSSTKFTTDDSVKDSGNSYGSFNKNLHRLEKYNRIGNIGNISTQKLIKEEVEVWRWNFINEVINDVKLFISLPIYG